MFIFLDSYLSCIYAEFTARHSVTDNIAIIFPSHVIVKKHFHEFIGLVQKLKMQTSLKGEHRTYLSIYNAQVVSR